MKWRILRIIAIIFIAFHMQLFNLFGDLPRVNAATTADVTVTVTPYGALTAPSNLILTDLENTTIDASWSVGSNSTYTMIRASRLTSPLDIDEGELIYYGELATCNITGQNVEFQPLYVSAWAFQSDNVTHSSYVTTEIGGEGVEEIAAQLEAFVEELQGLLTQSESLISETETFNSVFNDFYSIAGMVMSLIVVLGLAGLSYWRGDKPLFFLSGLAFIICGFAFSPISIWYSIILVLAGFFLCARTFTDRGIDKWTK